MDRIGPGAPFRDIRKLSLTRDLALIVLYRPRPHVGEVEFPK